MELQELREKSERLYDLRREIEQIEDTHDTILEPLKQERDAIQGEVIAGMSELKLASFKVEAGDTFTKAVRKSVAIIDPYRALEWAKEKGAVTIDTKLVAQMYRDGKELPEAFQARETEYIAVRRAKDANNN